MTINASPENKALIDWILRKIDPMDELVLKWKIAVAYEQFRRRREYLNQLNAR